jgi:tetratricopeptide (TPR) repeat protein
VREEWVDEGPVRDEAAAAVERARGETQNRQGITGRRKRFGPNPVAPEVAALIVAAAGQRRGERLVDFLGGAIEALDDDRLDDAHRALGPLLREVPDVAEVHEIAGKVAYRRGEWKRAVRELEEYRVRRPDDLTIVPVLADCHRALGKHTVVDELWRQLGEASPRPDVLAEGRIVAAGSLADRGEVRTAIALLERSTGRPRKVRDHHLRQWYVLADLYDRSGATVEARRLFERVAEHDVEFFDVTDRLRALGGARRSGRSVR